jgi:hypothetical protein
LAMRTSAYGNSPISASGTTTGWPKGRRVPAGADGGADPGPDQGAVNETLVYCHLPPHRRLDGVQNEPGALVGGAA